MSDEVIRIEYDGRFYRLVPNGYRAKHLMTENPADAGKFLAEIGSDVIVENAQAHAVVKMLLEANKPEGFTIN
jgi:hypothetical protein